MSNHVSTDGFSADIPMQFESVEDCNSYLRAKLGPEAEKLISAVEDATDRIFFDSLTEQEKLDAESALQGFVGMFLRNPKRRR